MFAKVCRTMLASGIAILCAGLAGVAGAQAEPLLTQGIGTSNCGRLAADLKPSEGLANSVNLMAYSWAQGYISAANISLAEADSKHVDLSQLDEAKVLNLILKYCKANPEAQPLGALNEYLHATPKVHIKWDKGSVEWSQPGQ